MRRMGEGLSNGRAGMLVGLGLRGFLDHEGKGGFLGGSLRMIG